VSNPSISGLEKGVILVIFLSSKSDVETEKPGWHFSVRC
jgi:hypothetical protein